MSDIVERLNDAVEIVRIYMEPSQQRNNLMVRLCDARAEIELLQRVVDAAIVHYMAETADPGSHESDRTLVAMWKAIDKYHGRTELEEVKE